MAEKAACVTFAKRNGAAFIFALFKKAIDCAITDSPPNEQSAAAIASVIGVIPPCDRVLSPLVHSNNP